MRLALLITLFFLAVPAVLTGVEQRLLILGDSLTAGYGLSEAEAFPALLGHKFTADGHPVTVLNAGVSGDTTAGGRSRVAWTLQLQPTHVMVALGGNDGLRGFPPQATEANLRAIIQEYQHAGCTVFLAGMRMPPSHGLSYNDAYEALFPKISQDLEVDLYPFLLADVGGVAELNQADGIHPNATGQQKLAENLYAWLMPRLQIAPTE
jgi:acyl-CoA thioesterase-1